MTKKLRPGQPTIQVEASFPASRPPSERVTRRINVPESVWRNLSAQDPKTAYSNRQHVAIRFERAANLDPKSVNFAELALNALGRKIKHPLPPPPPKYPEQPNETDAPPEHQLEIDFGHDFAQAETTASRQPRPSSHYLEDN